MTVIMECVVTVMLLIWLMLGCWDGYCPKSFIGGACILAEMGDCDYGVCGDCNGVSTGIYGSYILQVQIWG